MTEFTSKDPASSTGTLWRAALTRWLAPPARPGRSPERNTDNDPKP